MKKILLTPILMLCVTFTFAQVAFKPGNLVFYRYGDGTFKGKGEYPANGETFPTFLDEYTKAGVLVRSIPLPTTTIGSQRVLTGTGTANQEGALTRSVDGQYLLVMGYEKAPGEVDIDLANRVVGRISADGTVNTETATPHKKKGTTSNDLTTGRVAVTIDGSEFWIAAVSAGNVRYMPFGFNKGLAIPDMENAAKIGGSSSNFSVGIFSNILQ